MPAPWQPPDLDEIRPDRFVINNEKVRPLLRGEGERDGIFFHLQSSRREGWIARVRIAGFNVRTLQDRVDALPSIKRDVALGPEGLRPLSTARERIAGWDPDLLRWRDLPVVAANGRPAVRLLANEPIRRRRSRGGGDFFIAVAEQPERIGLRPVAEKDAIMHAYAILASRGRPPVLRFVATSDGYFVPDGRALLPAPHRETLELLDRDGAERWTFGHAQAPLAQQVFAKLGIELQGTGDREQGTGNREQGTGDRSL